MPLSSPPEAEPLSHVVTRRLTKAWEFHDGRRERQLLYYDFDRDEVASHASKSLLTSVDSFGHAVEGFLNKWIETPLADYLTSVAQRGLSTPIPWRQERALRLYIPLQGARAAAGAGKADAAADLRFAPTFTEADVDALAVSAATTWRFLGGQMPVGQALFFPSVGIAALPLAGSPNETPCGIFLPTSPTTFFAAIPAKIPDAVADRQLRAALTNRTLVALSVGLTCNRVVVPPAMRTHDRTTLCTAIRAFRSGAGNLEKAFRDANLVAGG